MLLMFHIYGWLVRGLSIVCVGVLAWAGCVEFEKQTLVYRHFPKADTLVIWQQYEGIGGDSDKDGLTNKEMDQLESVVSRQRTFFFANWVFEYNGDEIQEAIDDMRLALKEEKQGHSRLEMEVLPSALALAILVQKNVKIKNGPFYLNKAGKLSASQEVTVSNISKIIRGANALIRVKIRAGIEDGDFDDERDPQYQPLLERSLEDRLEYITLKDQHLSVRWPMSARLFKQDEKDEDRVKIIEQFQKAGGKVTHDKQLLTVEIGLLKDSHVILPLLIPDADFHDNGIKQVRELYGIKKNYVPDGSRADFFKRAADNYK